MLLSCDTKLRNFESLLQKNPLSGGLRSTTIPPYGWVVAVAVGNIAVGVLATAVWAAS